MSEKLTVAELLARNAKEGGRASSDRPRRRRSIDEGGVAVSDLTGSIPVVRIDDEGAAVVGASTGDATPPTQVHHGHEADPVKAPADAAADPTSVASSEDTAVAGSAPGADTTRGESTARSDTTEVVEAAATAAATTAEDAVGADGVESAGAPQKAAAAVEDASAPAGTTGDAAAVDASAPTGAADATDAVDVTLAAEAVKQTESSKNDGSDASDDEAVTATPVNAPETAAVGTGGQDSGNQTEKQSAGQPMGGSVVDASPVTDAPAQDSRDSAETETGIDGAPVAGAGVAVGAGAATAEVPAPTAEDHAAAAIIVPDSLLESPAPSADSVDESTADETTVPGSVKNAGSLPEHPIAASAIAERDDRPETPETPDAGDGAGADADIPAGLTQAASVDEPDSALSTPGESPSSNKVLEYEDDTISWPALLGQSALAIIVGVLIFFGFTLVWDNVSTILALALSLVVTLLCVGVVHALLRHRHALLLVLTFVVGIALTVGPRLIMSI